jgi:DNA transformation protein
MKLSSLPNIDIDLAAKLKSVELYTAEDLIRAGSQNAWIRLKAIYDDTSLNTLFILEAACQRMKYSHLDNFTKSYLTKFANSCT